MAKVTRVCAFLAMWRIEKKMSEKQELSRKITQLVHRLPLFPSDVDKLLTTAVKPSKDTAEILRLIQTDPRLSTELLHLANMHFGMAEGIETTEDAVRRIGVQPLVQLIGVSYARNAIREEFASLKYLSDYFDHSEDISTGCRILGEISDMPQDHREMYAIAGLVHDVGRLAIMVASNQTNSHVLGTLWDKMASIVREEKASLGMNHCEVGAQICRKWNFSSIIQEAVSRHHTPLINSDFSSPGALLFISHFLSASDLTGEILSAVLPPEVLANLNLTISDFDKAQSIYKSRTGSST